MNEKVTAVSAMAAAESPSAADRVTRAISVTKTQQSSSPDGCYRYPQGIYLSFFLYGFGQSFQDADRLCNVARLYFRTGQPTKPLVSLGLLTSGGATSVERNSWNR